MPDHPFDEFVLPPDDSATAPRRRGRRRAIGWSIAGVVLLLVIAAVVYGVLLAQRAFAVQDELKQAQAKVTDATGAAKALDFAAADASLEAVGAHTAKAVSMTDDLLWKSAEALPWVGVSAHAVSEIAAITDDTVAAARPVLKVAPTLVPAQLKPVDGKFPVDRLAAAAGTVQTFSQQLGDLTARLDRVDVDGTPAVISDAKAKLQSALNSVAQPVTQVSGLLAIVPRMLGGDGTQRYLLVFQNNAESLALGGVAASQTLIQADAGALKVVAQASSSDYGTTKTVDVPISASEKALYGDRYGKRVNLLTSRPDWPTAAAQAMAFWHRDIDKTEIDGVASIDPLALQRILAATGPITVDGHELNEGNAVRVLLHDVYTWWPSTAVMRVQSDLFFAKVAATVFSRIASGDFDVDKMMTAVQQSIDAGSILYWTDDADVSGMLAGAPVLGVLPTDNATTTTTGVYFRETSSSKVDFYVDTTAGVSSTCTDGTTTLTVTASMTFSATAAELADVPPFIKGELWNGKKIREQIFIYAPPGMTLKDVSMDGKDIGTIRTGNTDLGRVVAPFQMFLTPGGTASVTAVFTGTGDFGPLAVKKTPMIRDTKVTIDDGCAR